MTWLVGSTAGRLVAGIVLGGLAGSVFAAAFVVVALWAMHQPTLHPAVVVLAAVWLIATSAISAVGIRQDRTAILTA